MTRGRLRVRGLAVVVALAWVGPAAAQLGATPDNAGKLTFEALTAEPPPVVHHWRPPIRREARGRVERGTRTWHPAAAHVRKAGRAGAGKPSPARRHR